MSAERRRHPRYQVYDPIVADIETAKGRYACRLRNLSVGGLLLLVSGYVFPSPAVVGTQARVEFRVADQDVRVAGRIVQLNNGSLSLRMDQDLPEAWVRELTQGKSGSVQWQEDRINVLGVFNKTVLHDVMNGVRAGKMIDLSLVEGIDSSGLGIAKLALERNGKIEKCSQAIRALMITAGVCSTCSEQAPTTPSGGCASGHTLERPASRVI